MQFALVDYQVARQQSVTQANDPTGISYVLAFGAVPIGYTWKVDLLSVAVFQLNGVQSFQAPSLLIYDQPIEPSTGPVTGTTLSNYSPLSTFGGYSFWADYDDDASVTVLAGDQLLMAFDSEIPPGCVLAGRVQYGLYQGSAGQSRPVAGAYAPLPDTLANI